MGGQVVRENVTRDSLYDRDQYLWRLEAIAHLQGESIQFTKFLALSFP